MTSFHSICRIGSVLLFSLTVFLSTSCSSKPGGVKGKITVNGKPLARGLITFLPQSDKNDPVSATITDGAYDTTLIVPPGVSKIYIIASSTKPEETTGGNDLVARPKTAPSRDPNAVPTKFQDAETSGLTVTVKAGETTTFDKDLTP